MSGTKVKSKNKDIFKTTRQNTKQMFSFNSLSKIDSQLSITVVLGSMDETFCMNKLHFCQTFFLTD